MRLHNVLAAQNQKMIGEQLTDDLLIALNDIAIPNINIEEDCKLLLESAFSVCPISCEDFKENNAIALGFAQLYTQMQKINTGMIYAERSR